MLSRTALVLSASVLLSGSVMTFFSGQPFEVMGVVHQKQTVGGWPGGTNLACGVAGSLPPCKVCTETSRCDFVDGMCTAANSGSVGWEGCDDLILRHSCQPSALSATCNPASPDPNCMLESPFLGGSMGCTLVNGVCRANICAAGGSVVCDGCTS